MDHRADGHSCDRCMLQWGHVFSDVEMVMACALSDLALLSFNGATSFQTWKSDLEQIARQMGSRFNGATSFQTWKSVSGTGNRVGFPPCFNGATSFQTWKLFGRRDSGDDGNVLQWGHVFSDVEIVHKNIDAGV